jgi:ankyrin repeat protein
MHLLLLLSVMCGMSCLAMDTPSSQNPENAVLVKQLFSAIKKDEVPVVKEMLVKHPHLKECYRKMPKFHNDSVCALHIAAAYGSDGCLEYLLKEGLNHIVETKKRKNIPLHYVQTISGVCLLSKLGGMAQENICGLIPLCTILMGSETTLHKKNERQRAELASLLSPDNYNNFRNRDGETLLHRVVECPFAAQFLLEHRHHPNAVNKFGRTPFDSVLQTRFLFRQERLVLQNLFEKYGMFFFPRISPMQLFDMESDRALFLNRWAGVFALVHSKHDEDLLRSNRSSCMSNGVICNEHGCIINVASMNDLRLLFQNKEYAIYDLLNKKFKKVNALVKKNDYNGLREKLAKYSFVKKYECWMFSLLFTAIINNAQKCLEILMEGEIDKDIINKTVLRWRDVPDQAGGNLLHLAIFCNNPSAISLLMKHNINSTAWDSQSRSPMRCAVELKRDECFGVLRRGTAEHYKKAFKENDDEKIEQLSRDCFQNQGVWGDTDILCILTFLKSSTKIDSSTVLDIVKDFCPKMLLSFPNVITGESLLDPAIKNKDFKFVELLLKRGAIVEEYMLKNKHIPEDLKNVMQQKYEEQNCCICFEHPKALALIPCDFAHTDLICKQCYDDIEKCPLCRQDLLVYNFWPDENVKK